MTSEDGIVYAACKDSGGSAYVISLNDPNARTNYDDVTVHIPIPFELGTKDYILGDNIEAHLLCVNIFGESGSYPVTITIKATQLQDGSAPVTTTITTTALLNQYGIKIPIEQCARIVSVDIQGNPVAPTDFYVYRLELELQNVRIR